MIVKLCLLCLILLLKFARSETDEYLNESRRQCTSRNNLLSCAKFRSLRYLTTLREYYSTIKNETNNIGLIKMNNYYDGEELFSSARQVSTDSEFAKLLKFVQRQINYLLGSQGIAFNLPEGAEIITASDNDLVEERGIKKKKSAMVVLPLVVLFKLFMIKVLVMLSLAGIMFIKKAILLSALILPSILQHIKHCARAPHHYHHTPHHFEEEHDDGGYYQGGYSKDYERAYNTYIRNKS